MRVILLFFLCQLIVFEGISAQDWPNCGNFASKKGYPIGCKRNPYEFCATQSDECRNFVCNGIDDEFSNCGRACKEHPDDFEIQVENGVICYCSLPEQVMCQDLPPSNRNNGLFNISQHQGNTTSLRAGKAEIWGAAAKIPDFDLLPVFCFDKFTCGPISQSVCIDCQGKCYRDGYCYYLEDYPENSVSNHCSDSKSVAIETMEERAFIYQLLTETNIENKNARVLTAGVVPAGTTDIIWHLYDFPADPQIFDNLSPQSVDFSRFLFLKRPDASSMFGEMEWIMSSEDDFNLRDVILCKSQCNDCGRMSTTTDEPNTTTDATTTTTGDLETTTSEVEPTECPGKCAKSDQYGEEWECCSEKVCSKECPLDAIGNATWQCGFSNFESEWPNYNNCESSWVQEIDELIEAGNVTSFDLVVLMDQYLDESSMLGKDMSKSLEYTMTSLDLLIEEQEITNDPPKLQLHQRKFQTELAFGVVDKLLALEKPWEQISQLEKIELGRNIQDVSEKFGFAVTGKAAEIGNSYSMSYDKMAVQFKAQFIKLISSKSAKNVVQFPKIDDPLQSSIIITQLPNKLSQNKEILTLEAVSNNIPMEFAENMFPGDGNSFDDKKKKLNSGMVSLTLLFGSQKKAIHALDSGSAVIIKFRHERMAKGPSFSRVERELYPGENPTAIQGTAKCVFWDEKLGTNGAWDTRGCRLINSSHWYTFCECNHLSSFALLMDVHNFIAKSKVLEVIGIVCSSLSVICLALTLIILHTLHLKHTDRNSIGKHLCFCLMIGHLMALIVLDRSYFNMPQEICVGVGVVMHYIFLAAFMWMAIEGHHLYRMVVQVFDTGRDFTRLYLAAGYGTPLIIVAITCIVTGSLQDTGYANDDLCWLSSPSYVWAFMGPVLCLIMANLVVLVIAMKVAISASNKQNKKLSERVKIWIRGWFSMAALLGVTWIFGFFYIQVNPAFAYIYVILNGCQGVFLFLTRIIFNKQIMTSLRQAMDRKRMQTDFYGFKWMKRSSESTSQGPTWFIDNTATSQLSSSAPPSTSQPTQKVHKRSSRPTSSNISSDGGFYEVATEYHTHESYWTTETRNVYLSSSSRKTSREENLNAPQQRNQNSAEGLPVHVRFKDADILFELPEEDYD